MSAKLSYCFAFCSFAFSSLILLSTKINLYRFTLLFYNIAIMKNFFIATLIVLFLFGTKVYSETILEESKSLEQVEGLEQEEDDYPNPFDIFNGTSSGRTKVASSRTTTSTTSRVAAEPAVQGFYNNSVLNLVISIGDLFTVEVVNKQTGETVKRLIVNTNKTSEININTKSWSKGTYEVRLRAWSATDNGNFSGTFSIE